VCIGDKIYLRADGGLSYVWSPADSILANANGEIYAQILKPTVYRVKGHFRIWLPRQRGDQL
jgi:hypothetical protein